MELLILSMLTGITTLLGVMLAVFFGQPSKKILAFYLGLSAGIMSLIIIVDLLPAAFEQGPLQAVGIGLGIGLTAMIFIYELVHRSTEVRPVRSNPQKTEYLRTGLSISFAIAVHNIPEGIAIGAGFETRHDLSVMMALSIALHNIPAGIGMGIPLVLSGMKKVSIFLLSLFVSVCIPLGALFGKSFFAGSPFMVSMGMAFAAGAMGFIVWKEVAPASMRDHPLLAQLGMAVSLVFILLIHNLR